jgi:hypothetical protein
LNYAKPANKFPEVFPAGLFLPMIAAKPQGKFLQIDQPQGSRETSLWLRSNAA